MRALSAVSILLAGLAPLRGAETLFASGDARGALIELFTSEGCSSCPSAEQWLGAQRNDPGLWRNFVPVAWHVTYWDDLGWPDRFARQDFTARQHAYAAAWRSPSVYTPCFVRNGAEWRPFVDSADPTAAKAAGTLTATYDQASGALKVGFTPADAGGEYEVFTAQLGSGIDSKVRRGENAGRTLRHDFVALNLTRAALVAADDARRADVQLPKPAGEGVGRRALAVWVTRRGELAPVQATGGWLER